MAMHVTRPGSRGQPIINGENIVNVRTHISRKWPGKSCAKDSTERKYAKRRCIELEIRKRQMANANGALGRYQANCQIPGGCARASPAGPRKMQISEGCSSAGNDTYAVKIGVGEYTTVSYCGTGGEICRSS